MTSEIIYDLLNDYIQLEGGYFKYQVPDSENFKIMYIKDLSISDNMNFLVMKMDLVLYITSNSNETVYEYENLEMDGFYYNPQYFTKLTKADFEDTYKKLHEIYLNQPINSLPSPLKKSRLHFKSEFIIGEKRESDVDLVYLGKTNDEYIYLIPSNQSTLFKVIPALVSGDEFPNERKNFTYDWKHRGTSYIYQHPYFLEGIRMGMEEMGYWMRISEFDKCNPGSRLCKEILEGLMIEEFKQLFVI